MRTGLSFPPQRTLEVSLGLALGVLPREPPSVYLPDIPCPAHILLPGPSVLQTEQGRVYRYLCNLGRGICWCPCLQTYSASIGKSESLVTSRQVIHRHIHTHRHTLSLTHTYTLTDTRTYTHRHTYTYTLSDIHLYTYSQTYTHTYPYTQAHAQLSHTHRHMHSYTDTHTPHAYTHTHTVKVVIFEQW